MHVYDIFLPFEYRRDWVMHEFRFWAEQYVLQAFLTFDSEFEVLMASHYLAHKYRKDLKAAFPNLENLTPAIPNPVKWDGGSFWMRHRPKKRTRRFQADDFEVHARIFVKLWMLRLKSDSIFPATENSIKNGLRRKVLGKWQVAELRPSAFKS